MFSKALHNRWLRLCVGVLGELIVAASINLFIVPHNLYTGGLLGFCQLIRTVAAQNLELTPGFDFSGILYLLLNIPLLVLAWRNLGRAFVLRTITCTVCCSLFLTLIPVPAEPIIEDLLTSCLLGGIVGGFAGGMILTCGCSGGGLDILGLYLSKKGKGFTVGLAKSSDTFTAENAAGDKVMVMHNPKEDTMSISIESKEDADQEAQRKAEEEAAKQAEEQKKAEEAQKKAEEERKRQEEEQKRIQEEEAKKQQEAQNQAQSGGVTPAVKEAMDSYESFMNKYCDFMEKYTADGAPTSMLTDYLKMMSEYSETTKKLDDMDQSTWTDADMQYYLGVMNRVNQSLASVS